ncbi:MAG: hypothetical protein R3E18_00555 [Sphingomonadaceae bacterium]
MASTRHRERLAGLLALALPVMAGLGWMALAGAPRPYLLVNGSCLLVALAWTYFGQAPQGLRYRRVLVTILLAALFLPLLTGPELSSITHDPVARWLPLGPLQLHSGMLALPALAVLASRDPDYAAPILLTALFALFLQPDAASGFALTFAAVGLHHATRDWRHGLVAIIGFVASIFMALHGELPPQPFVERVLDDALAQSWPVAILLFAALLGSYFLILKALPMAHEASFAMAGTLFGFALMAVLSHYPTPLLGYGAAPVLGYGMALGLIARSP